MIIKRILLYLSVIYSSEFCLFAQIGEPPRGDCRCDCWVDEDNEYWDIEPCGEECEIVGEEVLEKFKETWIESDNSCISGSRKYSREVTIKLLKRQTKSKGTYYAEQIRKPGPFGAGENCDECPPCEPVMRELRCGDILKNCPSKPDDTLPPVYGPTMDEGCLEPEV